MKAIPFVERDTAKVVGIWIRVSTEDQARGESPEHHEKRARAYAELRGWEVVEVYHLEGVSGKAVVQHPEAKRMLADVKSGRITCLWRIPNSRTIYTLIAALRIISELVRLWHALARRRLARKFPSN